MKTDEQTIRDLQTTWLEASERGDLAMVLSFMTDDAIFLTPGRPPMTRDDFAAEFSTDPAQRRVEASGDYEEIVVVGDVAYARGHLTVESNPGSGAETRQRTGYTLTIFRRQPDGRWLLARDANLLT